MIRPRDMAGYRTTIVRSATSPPEDQVIRVQRTRALPYPTVEGLDNLIFGEVVMLISLWRIVFTNWFGSASGWNAGSLGNAPPQRGPDSFDYSDILGDSIDE